MRVSSLTTAILIGFCGALTVALDNGLGLTPVMGWLSWQRYRCNIDCENQPDECISESLYKRMADRLVAEGYRDAGYVYVNIDDCWSLLNRDTATGRLVADPKRFPSGISALAKYMHERGLKLGIYGDAGTKTCCGYPGSMGHFELDAHTFAEWGVDMLKLDGCYIDPALMTEVKNIVDFYVKNQDNFFPIAKPGAFHDPDMLIIGNFGLSLDQSRTQMALWAIFAAPLLMSNNLERIRREERDILLNRHVIAVNQDPEGLMGSMRLQTGKIQVFTRPVRPIVNGTTSWAVAVVNRAEGGIPKRYALSTKNLNFSNKDGYFVTDLFDHNRLITVIKPGELLTLDVNPSGVRFVKATAIGGNPH
ncbi:alpha-N-acetylgalactosaminidase isoform 1 [Tropilaelaps mercedesae]|uniref:Alpha-galactosidase n=1 Tax=Tropilaelaps mercedesae TaxID=418985 RepID=A0A1V9XBA9_9ACAR|nr:alpha-N-acetylgalactosaminidase isoform 1 [Tropilaelaps mercedesae]